MTHVRRPIEPKLAHDRDGLRVGDKDCEHRHPPAQRVWIVNDDTDVRGQQADRTQAEGAKDDRRPQLIRRAQSAGIGAGDTQAVLVAKGRARVRRDAEAADPIAAPTRGSVECDLGCARAEVSEAIVT